MPLIIYLKNFSHPWLKRYESQWITVFVYWCGKPILKNRTHSRLGLLLGVPWYTHVYPFLGWHENHEVTPKWSTIGLGYACIPYIYIILYIYIYIYTDIPHLLVFIRANPSVCPRRRRRHVRTSKNTVFVGQNAHVHDHGFHLATHSLATCALNVTTTSSPSISSCKV